MQCDCGQKTNTIRYKNGKKTCQKCAPQNLSGQFLRHMEGERNYYQKDILQPSSPFFKDVYKEGKNLRKNGRMDKKRKSR